MKRFSASKGFTMIELMIVIAIIATLSGIIIPNISRAKAQANYVACQETLKNTATAIETYIIDHNDYPVTENLETALVPDYVGKVPTCPQSKLPYFYDTDPTANHPYYILICDSGNTLPHSPNTGLTPLAYDNKKGLFLLVE